MGAIRSNADVEQRAVRVIRGILRDASMAERLGPQPRLERTLKILDDVNQVTQEAAQRVTTIVQSLKSFARLDQPELEWAQPQEKYEVHRQHLADHLRRDVGTGW